MAVGGIVVGQLMTPSRARCDSQSRRFDLEADSTFPSPAEKTLRTSPNSSNEAFPACHASVIRYVNKVHSPPPPLRSFGFSGNRRVVRSYLTVKVRYLLDGTRRQARTEYTSSLLEQCTRVLGGGPALAKGALG